MTQAIYFVLLLISIGYLILLLSKYKDHISVYYFMLAVTVVFENLGFLQMSGAKSVEAALLGSQVTSLAYPFILLFMIKVIAELCKVEIPKAVTNTCVGIGLLIFLGSSTMEYTDVYYRSVELVESDGYSFLSKEYGPLHIIGPIYIIGIICYGLGIVTYALRNKKSVSHFVSVGSLALLIGTSLTYLCGRLFELQVELLPIAFVLGYGAILAMLKRVKTYDVEGISRDSIEESHEYGFVICDGKGRFSGADDNAKKWFPELNDLEIDYRITHYDTDFLIQLKKWVLEGDGEESVCFEREGRILEIRHSVPSEHGGALHCIRMRDDTQHQRYLKLVENYNDRLEEQVQEKTARLVEVQNDIIVSMASIVENRDNDTGGHIRRTSDLVRVFVTHLMSHNYSPELKEGTSKRIIEAAPLHDFGKIAIPDGILNKPGKFTCEEYEQMKLHSQKGAGIVARILQSTDDLEFKTIAVNMAHYHHEKWDGSGYPCGLSETAIPLEARIMALADVFDALVSKRVYKEQFSYDKAFAIIDESSGSHFDPELCTLFMNARPQIERLYDSYSDL